MENCPTDGLPFDIRYYHREDRSEADTVLDSFLWGYINCEMKSRLCFAVDDALDGNIKNVCQFCYRVNIRLSFSDFT